MSLVPLPHTLVSCVWMDWTGRWWHIRAGSRISHGFLGLRLLWDVPLPWRAFPGEDTELSFPWNCSAARPELLRGSFLSCCGFPTQLQFVAAFQHIPHVEESGQHLLVRSAGSTCGMPLITVLIGFLLVPSIFSKQKAEGSRCYLLFCHKCCSCGDQRSRNSGGFFPFFFVP